MWQRTQVGKVKIGNCLRGEKRFLPHVDVRVIARCGPRSAMCSQHCQGSTYVFFSDEPYSNPYAFLEKVILICFLPPSPSGG